MRIAETFHSIQGEGILSGTPSFFIRLSGCNLRCRWCDTPYASWHPEGTDWDVMALAHAASESGAHHAVITGGEPLIAPALPDLMQALKDQGLHLTLETAGTLPPADFPCDLASLSPKLANSTPSIETAGVAWVERHEKTRLQPDILRQWCQFSDYQLKFVVATPADLEEIKTVVTAIRLPIPPERILLMPEGTDPTTLRQRYPLLIAACLEHGYRLCPRLHIDLFGNTRGT